MLRGIGQIFKHVFASQNYAESNYSQDMGSFYSLSAVDIDGKETGLKKFEGSVSLVINVATYCGLTKKSYTNLVRLHDKYRDDGFVVLAFPCNQFMNQEPKSEAEIKKFAQETFNVQFPMFSKIDVNGDDTHPVYKWLKTCFPGDVTWNFAGKFLIDRKGVPMKRFGKEDWDAIEEDVVKALGLKEKKPDPSESKE